MAIAFDNKGRNTANAIAFANHSITVFPVGVAKGLLVFAHWPNSTAAYTSITIGGVNVPAIPAAFASDTGGENGNTQAYFLGAGIPVGSQTLQCNRASGSTGSYVTWFTVTAVGDTLAAGIFIEEQDQFLTEENINDGSPGSNSVRFVGLFSGRTSLPIVGANSTAGHSVSFGTPALSAGSCYETVPGQGSRPVGFERPSLDDVAAVYLAITEGAPPPTLPVGVIKSPPGSSQIVQGDQIKFSGSASGGVPPYQYLWIFEVGSGVLTNTDQIPGPLQFNNAGTWTVQLSITDNLGAVSTPLDTRIVTVLAGPTATVGIINSPAGVMNILTGDTVNFLGTASGGTGPYTHLWEIVEPGSGVADSTAEDPGLTVFNVAGVWTLRYTATDSLSIADVSPPTVVITVLVSVTLNQFNGNTVGIWIDTETNISEVFDLLMQSIGAWWSFTRGGALTASGTTDPLPNGPKILKREIVNLERIPLSGITQAIPNWAATVQYKKNYTVQSQDELAGLASTDVARVAFAGKEFRENTKEDIPTQTAHPSSVPFIQPTLLTTSADADTEAARLLALFKVNRDLLRVVISAEHPVAQLNLGRSVSLQVNRFGYDNGKDFLITSMTEWAPRPGLITVTLWG